MAKLLEKRTNILFDMDQWQKLIKLSQERESSIGDLVRTAVHKTYFTDEETVKRKRRAAYEDILKIRPHFKGKIDYKELINYGRKW